MGFTYLILSEVGSLLQSFLCEPALKPDSHIKIVKDYRPKTGKDHETLRESVQNLLKIV